MRSNPYSVAVVLDREYGTSIFDLAVSGPVWIMDTPTNRAATEKHWAEFPDRSHLDGVTIFDPYGDSPEKIFLNEIDVIDLHHGAYSAKPPYSVLRAIGAYLTDEIESELSKYGFNEFSPAPDGFQAIKNPPMTS